MFCTAVTVSLYACSITAAETAFSLMTGEQEIIVHVTETSRMNLFLFVRIGSNKNTLSSVKCLLFVHAVTTDATLKGYLKVSVSRLSFSQSAYC